MELLPFVQEASQYSAIITVGLYGLLSLQFRFMGSGLKRDMEQRTQKFEASQDKRLAIIQESIHELERTMLKTFGAHGQRIAALEGANSK